MSCFSLPLFPVCFDFLSAGVKVTPMCKPCNMEGPKLQIVEQQKEDMVIGGLAQSMFNITDGPSRWSGTGLPPFTSFYLYLTLKTADREQRLWFHSFDKQKLNIPWLAHTGTFIFTICSHCHPQLPALLAFMITLCSKSRIHSEQMVRISILDRKIRLQS